MDKDKTANNKNKDNIKPEDIKGKIEVSHKRERKDEPGEN